MTDQPPPHAPRTLRDLAEIADPVARAKAIIQAISDTRSLASDLSNMRREAVLALREAGWLQADIAKLLGVTYGRVSQLESEGAAVRPVMVERTVPTPPAVRAAPSLFLAENEDGKREMLSVGPATPPSQVAKLMGLPPGALAMRRRKIQRKDGVPVRLPDSWHHLEIVERVPALGSIGFVPGGLEVAFLAAGLEFDRAVEFFRVRRATADEAEVLELGDEDTIAEFFRCSYETGGLPVHCLHTVCVGDRTLFPVPTQPDDRVF